MELDARLESTSIDSPDVLESGDFILITLGHTDGEDDDTSSS